MLNIHNLIDTYDIKARLYPYIILLYPIIITILIFHPLAITSPLNIPIMIILLLAYPLMINLIRDRGKKIESELFEKIGGLPSAVLLQHTNNELPIPLKARYHSLLERYTGITAPTIEQDIEKDPKAMYTYKSWSRYLKSITQNNIDYPLVNAENTNYGFRRNLLGIKTIAVIIGIISIIVLSLKIYKELHQSADIFLSCCALISNVLYTATMITIVNTNWVKTSAFKYAHQLIDTINNIDITKKK